MNLSEFEKLLYAIAMDSVFMSRPENGTMINSMITELQNIQNAGNILRGDTVNDSYKMAMSTKLAEFENVFIMTASQRLTEHGIPVMNSYNPPQMQQSMQNPYGQQQMQNPYGQPMQNPYGQPMQNPYGQSMMQNNPYGQQQQQPIYGQQKPQMPSYMQQPQQMPQMQQQPQQMQQMQQQQPQPQQMQQQSSQMQQDPAPMPVREPAPVSKPLPPISYDSEMPRASTKKSEDKQPSISSGAGVFGMGGEALPGAKKGNEPAGSAAGRDFLLSLLEKQ